MTTITRLSLFGGILWAALLLALALRFPAGGVWTIDDGVKRIAATESAGFWAERLPDGGIRARLAHPEENLPLNRPFAKREGRGLTLGFAPLTRALAKLAFGAGETGWRVVPALVAILLWIACEIAGLRFAFLLLPLTFYGLVPWEHALSWLLAVPALYLTFVHPGRSRGAWLAGAGALLALASALRPETLLLAAALPIYLWLARRRVHSMRLSLGIALGIAVFGIAYYAMGGGSPLAQLSMNFPAEGAPFAPGTWIEQRGLAVYWMFVQCDPNPWLSLGILALIVLGAMLLVRAEQTKTIVLYGLGALLLAGGIGFYQVRLWSSPIPLLWLILGNSLVTAVPWALLLFHGSFVNRPALKLALILMGAAVLLTPVWEGVHWGPRVLLFASPLLLIDLYRSGRARGLAFAALLAVTLIQTASSAALVQARMRETGDRVALARAHLGTPVICPTTSQCADLAALWEGREFFTASTPRELRQLLGEFRFASLDTVWLHTGANDSLLTETLSASAPVTTARKTFLQAKSLYTTWWLIHTLAMNRDDPKWAEMLETAAGEWMLEGRKEDALRFQREAVRIAPDSAATRHNLALILAELGRTEEARAEAEAARALNPDLEPTRRLLEMLQENSATAP
ncbi:MAG: hypothetical protein PHI18_04025 [bacterium]|nr:hypothetical protein [bacterium]